MRVSIVLMKGFDGCGVSRFAIEHQKELRRTGHVCDIYSFAGNSYCREKAHKDKEVIYYKEFTSVDFSSYDVLILNSYEKDFKESDLEYYRSLQCKKVAMMHEILRQNIGRISHIWDWIEASDMVSSFSSEMDFVVDLKKHIENPQYFSFKMAMSDNDMDELYNKSLKKSKSNSLVYFGRWTTMKNPSRLFDLKKLDSSLDLSMIGLERSIGAFHDIFNRDEAQVIKLPFLSNINDYYNINKDTSKVQVYPPTDRSIAMEILSNSLYGCSFYRLKDSKAHNLGNRMEFTQIEMSCVCLPVFDKSWGQKTFDSLTGKSFYELGDNAIYSDINNLQETIDEMNRLAANKKEYEERRKNIFDIVKRNFGATNNIRYFYDCILNHKIEEI